MATYRKRPVVIQAQQYDPASGRVPAGVCWADNRKHCAHLSGTPHVHTREGPLAVSPGDYIITGIKGEQYPCKPDIFEQTYELVDDRIWAGCPDVCGCGCPGETCDCPASQYNLPERCGCLGWVPERTVQ